MRPDLLTAEYAEDAEIKKVCPQGAPASAGIGRRGL